MTRVWRRRNLDQTDSTGRPYGHEGKDKEKAPTSQAMPKTARKPPEAKRKAHHRVPFILHLSSDSLISDCWPSELRVNFWFLSHIQSVVPCYGSARKPIC